MISRRIKTRFGTRCTASCTRNGLSVLEVVLVIAILAILIALLLPAVAHVRESASVLQTNNNERRRLIQCFHRIVLFCGSLDLL